jgi:hypothetical protein
MMKSFIIHGNAVFFIRLTEISENKYSYMFLQCYIDTVFWSKRKSYVDMTRLDMLEQVSVTSNYTEKQ